MSENHQSNLITIIGKREQRSRWIFIIASLPFFLFALWGYQYGAFPFYFIPGLICIVQFFYPTLLGWFLIFCLYLIGSGLYIFVVLKDIFKMIGGQRSGIFVDLSDTVFFCILILLIFVLAVALIKLRPVRLKAQ
jgi:hypothetical protein